MTLTPGTFVRHPGQPSWGTGRVLEMIPPDKIRVRFVHAGEKVLLSSFAPLEPTMASAADEASLEGPKPRSKPKTGSGSASRPLPRGQVTAKGRPLEHLIAEFLWVFPLGFKSTAYGAQERDAKVKAHEMAVWELSEARLGAAIESGRFDDVVKGALLVMSATTLVSPKDQLSLKDALAKPAVQEKFSKSLVALLHGNEPFQARFEAFAELLSSVGAATWTIATYFPFILFPKAHMFLKAVVTQKAAEACGFNLAYDQRLNWRTYEQLLAFARKLEESLAQLEPADMIDIQSFLWVAGGGQEATA